MRCIFADGILVAVVNAHKILNYDYSIVQSLKSTLHRLTHYCQSSKRFHCYCLKRINPLSDLCFSGRCGFYVDSRRIRFFNLVDCIQKHQKYNLEYHNFVRINLGRTTGPDMP